ncbi:MAG: DUF302 domain-containing protein [Halobacteria archaeon]|nr:DUF302 domain-containing protein [Halobacteria archaeon]
MSTSYTISEDVQGDFDEVVEKTIRELEDEGFGVLCDIDVRATLKKKLDEEFRNYRILGACNPGFAHQALEEEIELGTLLPCNVIVYENDDGTVTVSAINPGRMLSITGNDDLESIAEEVHARFERVLENL